MLAAVGREENPQEWKNETRAEEKKNISSTRRLYVAWILIESTKVQSDSHARTIRLFRVGSIVLINMKNEVER